MMSGRGRVGKGSLGLGLGPVGSLGGGSPRAVGSSRSVRFLPQSQSTTSTPHMDQLLRAGLGLGLGLGLPLPSTNTTNTTKTKMTSSSHPHGHGRRERDRERETDKTVCEYCGVSYLTMSEMRSLQTTVKEQEERLSHYKTLLQDNVRLKDTLTNMRKTHVGELIKQEEQAQRIESVKESLQSQLERLKGELRESKSRHLDLEQRYAICSEDSRQQEEMIRELRDEVEEGREVVGENSVLKDKVNTLESTLQRVLIQFKQLTQDTNTTKTKTCSGSGSGRSHGDESRMKFNTDVKKMEQSEWGNWRRTKQLHPHPHAHPHPQPYGSSQPDNSKPRVGSLASVETHDLKRQIALLSERLRCVSEEHANCSDLHSFLRDTMDKLKSENEKLHESVNSLRVTCEGRGMEVSTLEAKLEGVSGENERLREMGKQLQTQLTLSHDHNKALRQSHDPGVVESLQNRVQSLEREIERQRVEMDELSVEWEGRLTEAQRESGMERQRADSFLAASVEERGEVERRWEERWDRHEVSLNQQIHALNTHHEHTLRKTKEHETMLQKDLNVLNEKFVKSKEAWETYRKTLQGQMHQWRSKYEAKSRDLESTRKSKVDVEILFQEKSKELEMLHEMVREGCEERQELQKKVESLEERVEEMGSQGVQLKRFMTTNTTNTNKNPGGEGGGSGSGGPVKHTTSESILSLSSVSKTTPSPNWKPISINRGGVSGVSGDGGDGGGSFPHRPPPLDMSSLQSILFTVGRGKDSKDSKDSKDHGVSGSGGISPGKETKSMSMSSNANHKSKPSVRSNSNCNGSSPTQTQTHTLTLQSRKSNK